MAGVKACMAGGGKRRVRKGGKWSKKQCENGCKREKKRVTCREKWGANGKAMTQYFRRWCRTATKPEVRTGMRWGAT